ncbi:MAG: sugar ABC transporter substrate-binding protein [Anaerolineae bacterium]|nr:sugar ABC transporter substrate-binding protein [Anaerolineae bacterium]
MRKWTRRELLRAAGALGLAAAGGAALAACAGATPAPAAGETAAPAAATEPPRAAGEKVKLVFEWPQYTPEKARYGEYIINTYMEKNPDIEIEPMYNTNALEKVTITIAGGTPPDCGWLGGGWPALWKNLLVLDDLIQRDADEVRIDDFYPKLLDATQWLGQRLTMPMGFTCTLIYFNKKLFDDAGVDYPTDDWTWDDLKQMGAAIADPENNLYGVMLDQGSYYAPLFIAGPIADEDWRNSLFYSDLRVYIVQMWKDLWNTDKIAPPPAVTAEQGLMPMFEAGRIGMYAGGSWFLEPARMLEFDWDIVPLPIMRWSDGDHRGTGMWTEELFIINTTPHKEEAWQFIKWASGPELLTWAASEGHVVPGRMPIAESEAFAESGKKPDNIRAFLVSAEFAIPYLVHPMSSKIATAVGDPLSAFFSLEETLSAKEATQTAHDNIQVILDEWWATEGGA